jgi:cobalt-zinc-cadmium efflux system membrane fusion protein
MRLPFMKNSVFLWILLSLFYIAAKAYPVYAHGDELEVEEKGTRGPILLSSKQEKAIDLLIEKVSSRPMAQMLSVNGKVATLPNQQNDVTTRVSGKVAELYVKLGEVVKNGQPLAKVESRLIGDPPPSAVIHAPMAGIIDEQNIHLGQAIEPSTILFRISNRTQMLIIGNVYEEDLGRVVLNQEANVHVLSYPNKLFQGKVILIEPTLDLLTRIVKIWISVPNTDNLLKPNMFARANLTMHNSKEVLSVPNAAILEANGEKFVFVKDHDNYQRVIVSVGSSDENYTEVTHGLKQDDLVVKQGQHQLYTLWLTGGKLKAEE